MKKAWVIVADSAVARLLQADHPIGALQELKTEVHPEGRLHNRELANDRPGRSFNRVGPGNHAVATDAPPHEHEADAFANELAQQLHKARTEGRFDALVLVADPAFLGMLNKHLDEPTRKLVTLEVSKNLVHLDTEAIRKHLPEKLFSAL